MSPEHQLFLEMFWYAAAALLMGLFLALLAAASRIHGTFRISARPQWQPTALDDLPIEFRPKLGKWIQQMQDLGFVVAANVTSREPLGPGQVTECLLVNRAAGMRAVIYCRIRRGKYWPSAYFVSEFSDGTTVKTNNSRLVEATTPHDPREHDVTVPYLTPLDHLYQRHLAQVGAHSPRDAAFVLPPEGAEIEYITNRHAAARAMTVPALGFILDESGDSYRPTWRKSLRMALANLPVVGRMLVRNRIVLP